MANMTIDEATPKGSAVGTEKLPISDSGAAKSITTANIKDYVLGAIAALTSADATTLAEDEIYIKQDGAMKKVSAATLAEAVYARLYGKTAQTTFAGTDVISLKSGTDYKTTTMTALTAYLAGEINPTFDIHAMSNAAQLVGGDTDCEEVAVSQKSGNTWSTLKTTIANLANYVIGKLAGVATQEYFGTSDYMLVETGGSVKKVLKANVGLKDGDVTGPNDAIANGIPQWNATNSKALKAGLSVSTQIGSTSSDSQVPTALAVYDAIMSVAEDAVSGPESTTQNKIPQWDSTTKLLKDGLSVQTSVRATDSAEDTAVATEKAVATELATKVKIGGTPSSGKLLRWGPNADTDPKTVNMEVVTEIGASPTDDQVATAQAVKEYVDAAIAAHLSAYTHTAAQ